MNEINYGKCRNLLAIWELRKIGVSFMTELFLYIFNK